jgi:hypothetical protein
MRPHVAPLVLLAVERQCGSHENSDCAGNGRSGGAGRNRGRSTGRDYRHGRNGST